MVSNVMVSCPIAFFFSSRRRHTRSLCDWSSDVCSSDLRALRLTMRNLGGATADTMEKSTHGWPGKYTMCLAENAARNPWEPLHVELGFAPDVSIVVVVAARGIITIVEASQESGL